MNLTEQNDPSGPASPGGVAENLAKLSAAEKNLCLLSMATALDGNRPAIIEANEKDMVAGKESGLSSALLEID
jgi:glutamate-5-semialdehyde dehydrogenase